MDELETKTTSFKLSKEPGFKHRLIEVILTTLASAAVAAISVTWSVSASWTSMHEGQQKLFENQLRMEGRLETIEKQFATNSDLDQSQQIAIAETKAHNDDIIRRLASIEAKIDQQVQVERRR